MDRQSMESAREHAEAARHHLEKLNAEPRGGSDLRQHWMAFLTELNRAFNKLQHGAKQGKSGPWAGRIRHDLKTDELLCYLKNARDAHEHGVERVVSQEGTAEPMLSGDPKFLTSITIRFDDGSEMTAGGPDRPFMKIVDFRLRLVPATNHGRTYAPPTSHLGASLVSVTAEAIGELALTYLDSKIREGFALVSS